MQLSKHSQTALLATAVLMTFAIGAGATSCVMGTPDRRPTPPPSPPRAPVREAPPPNAVVGYARQHPDPAISGPFADKLESGEIKTIFEKPREHAMASFGPRDGGYALTIDPERLKTEPTREDIEDVLSILSHEHAHYRQYVEGEMHNYSRHGRDPMTEAQCTLTILVEIDAHGKACRDARAYGWTSHVALSPCGRTIPSITEFFLRERIGTQPECKPVWEFFAGKEAAKPAARIKTRPSGTPRKRTGAIYMPPP